MNFLPHYRVRVGTSPAYLAFEFARGKTYCEVCQADEATEFDDPVSANHAIEQCLNAPPGTVIEPTIGEAVVL